MKKKEDMFLFFTISVSDLEDPPESYNGEVDIDMFWDALAMEMIGRGFVQSNYSLRVL